MKSIASVTNTGGAIIIRTTDDALYELGIIPESQFGEAKLVVKELTNKNGKLEESVELGTETNNEPTS